MLRLTTIGRKLAAIFVAIAVVFGVVCLVSYNSVDKLSVNAALVEHTYDAGRRTRLTGSLVSHSHVAISTSHDRGRPRARHTPGLTGTVSFDRGGTHTDVDDGPCRCQTRWGDR